MPQTQPKGTCTITHLCRRGSMPCCYFTYYEVSKNIHISLPLRGAAWAPQRGVCFKDNSLKHKNVSGHSWRQPTLHVDMECTTFRQLHVVLETGSHVNTSLYSDARQFTLTCTVPSRKGTCRCTDTNTHLWYHNMPSAWIDGNKDDTPPGSQLGQSWLSSIGSQSW